MTFEGIIEPERDLKVPTRPRWEMVRLEPGERSEINSLVLLEKRLQNPEELKLALVEVLANVLLESVSQGFSNNKTNFYENQLENLKNNESTVTQNDDDFLFEAIDSALQGFFEDKIVVTFDGSIDNATNNPEGKGRSYVGGIDIDTRFIGLLCSRFYILTYEKLGKNLNNKQRVEIFLTLINKELETTQRQLEIKHLNCDHHGCSITVNIEEKKEEEIEKEEIENETNLTEKKPDEKKDWEPFSDYFKRYETPSSSLQLFNELAKLATSSLNNGEKLPKIIYFFESLKASDPDSLMCVILIKLFEENPDYFINGTPEYQILEFLVEIIDAYDVHAGFVTNNILNSIRLPESLKNYNIIQLVDTIKKTVLKHTQSTVHHKPDNSHELVEIIRSTIQNINSFVLNSNDFMTGGQATVLENQPNSNKQPSEQKPLEQIFFEISNYNIFVLNKAPSDSEILELQKENKHAIYLILKSEEDSKKDQKLRNWSIFMIPELYATSEYTTPEELKNRAEFGKESQMLKNYLNSLAYFLKNPSENPETGTLNPSEVFNSACEKAFDSRNQQAEEVFFGGGCITGCRNNPIPLNFEKMKIAIKYYESNVTLENNTEISS